MRKTSSLHTCITPKLLLILTENPPSAPAQQNSDLEVPNFENQHLFNFVSHTALTEHTYTHRAVDPLPIASMMQASLVKASLAVVLWNS